MKWFHNMKISVKLLAGFLIVVIILGIVGFQGVTSLKSINTSYSELHEKGTMGIVYINNVALAYQRVRVSVLYSIIKHENVATYIEDMKKNDEVMQENLDKYKETLIDDQDKENYNKLVSQISEYNKLRETVVKYAAEDNDEAALEFIRTTIGPVAAQLNESFDNIINLNISYAEGTEKANTDNAARSTMIMYILIGAGIALAVVIGLVISMLISRPVRKLTAAAERLALGDISIQVEADTKDEIGKLATAFKNMVESTKEQVGVAERIAAGNLDIDVKLRSDKDVLSKSFSQIVSSLNRTLIDINNAADQVAAGSRQVSSSSMALSQGSTEQASSIEEITASITQIAAQTKQNAVNANQANDIAETSRGSAIEGNKQMKEMLTAMEEINDASSSISKIIKVIDEIAFQTNLLALNAAVEAARAGQHGKGFAVVAEEVRNLAARSASAAKETTEMIEGSIKKVEAGTKIANETAGALGKIVDGVSRVNELVSQIAIASNEQANAVTQINQAINQVAQVTQMNTATAEESASASEELSSQSVMLKEMISQFNLKKENYSGNSLRELDRKTLKMLEDMINSGSFNAKAVQREDYSEGLQEAAVSRDTSKIKITLDDKEFGKY